jgi:hypothetical protein
MSGRTGGEKVRIRAILSIAALAVLLPSPAWATPAMHAATTLSIEDQELTIYYGFPAQRTQTVHIGGDADQTITVAFGPTAPPNFLGGERLGSGCTWQGKNYVCPGHGDLTLTYGPNKYDDLGYTLEISTPDGAFALGGVNFVSRTDLEFDPQWTGYVDYDAGTTAAFNVRVRQKPLSAYSDGGLRPQVYIDGLDLSLGVPQNCLVNDGRGICSLNSRLTGSQSLAFTVPACSASRRVVLTVVVFNVDVNDDNDTFVVPGLAKPTNCAASGGTGGGSGGGGQPVASASATMPVPTTAGDAGLSPGVNAPPSTASAAAAPSSEGKASGMGVGTVVGAAGIALALAVGAVGNWWWRRRRHGGPGATEGDGAVTVQH